MVVHDFDLVRIAAAPNEANPILPVDSDAVLPFTVAAQTYNTTPFGEAYGAYSPGDTNEQGYTGHVEDATGLTYMQARYYDPIIGRFLSTDPVGYLDQLNLYAYAYNDPVNNTDPTGECGPLCGAIVGGVVYVAAQAITGEKITLSGAAIAVAGGAVGAGMVGNVAKIGAAATQAFGKTAGLAVSVGGTASAGSAVGGGAQLTSNAISIAQGEDMSLTKGVGTAATIGAIAGAAGSAASAAVAPQITAAGRAGQLSISASSAKDLMDTTIGAQADLAGSAANNLIAGNAQSEALTSESDRNSSSCDGLSGCVR